MSESGSTTIFVSLHCHLLFCCPQRSALRGASCGAPNNSRLSCESCCRGLPFPTFSNRRVCIANLRLRMHIFFLYTSSFLWPCYLPHQCGLVIRVAGPNIIVSLLAGTMGLSFLPHSLTLAIFPVLCFHFSEADQTSNSSQSSYIPIAYHLGTQPVIDGLQSYSGNTLKLDTSTPVLTLDYGDEVGGFPFVEIASVSGSAAQIELKYSEQFAGLGLPYGDGPWYLETIQGCHDDVY